MSLARRGIRSILVERAPRLEEMGAGLQLSPNAGRVLDGLGLGPALDGVSVRPQAIRIGRGGSGRTIAAIPLGATAERRYGAPYRVLHRADLQSVLLEAVRAEPLIELRLGETVVRTKGMPPVVVCDSGRGRSEHSGRLLVGADGVRSAVRAALAGRSELPPPRYTAWRTLVEAPELPEESPATRVWLAPAAHLVAYPMAHRGRTNLVLVTPAAAGVTPPRTAIAAFGGAAGMLLARASAWTPWPLFDIAPVAVFGTGPVTLLGDAAHPVLPFLAQGAALAIEDAAVLAARLAQMPDAGAAARAYEGERAPRWRRVCAAAVANGRIYHLSGVAAAIRDATLLAAPPQRLLGRYDWLFGWRPPG